jgi:hypothetical protein
MEETKIFEIIKASDQVPAWVTKARDYSKDLNALVNGVDFADLLIRIEHKEDEKKQTARRKYARSIKDIFERLLRPVDNVYSATGGVKKYPDNAERALKVISTIRDGKTLEKWLQNNWMNGVYNTDPNGVIIYEWIEEKFYPTYKSIGSIRNYEADGQRLIWILYEPVTNTSGIQEWRFIDSEKDYLIKKEQDVYSIIEEKTFKNPFDRVPGIVISDIIKIGTKERLSPIHSIIESAKEFLRDLSHKSMFKFLLWDPLFWRYAMQCQKCHGTVKTGDSICPDCVDGYYVKKDITDCATLPFPTDKDQPSVPKIAGFEIPPPEIMAEFTKELDLLYNIMFETIWGVQDASKVQKTATEVYQDLQPEITRLNVYADVAQWVECFFTNLGIKFMLPNEKEEAVILYGRNFILESVQSLLDKYEASKAKGDNSAILDRQLKEWILSKYKNDPITMNEELLRLKVEPFIHYTIEQVKNIYGPIEAKEKMLFPGWWLNEAEKSKDAKVLIEAFEKYCDEELSEDEQADEMEPELDENGNPKMDEFGKPIMKPKVKI